MVPFDAGYIYMCELKNRASAAAQTQTPTQDASVEPVQSVGPAAQNPDTPGEPIPPGAPHLKWGAPATLSGTVNWGEFDNCCFNGESTRTRYLSLTLKQATVIDGDANYVANPTVVHTIQISNEKSLAGLLQQQSVEIRCASLDSGDTGHYAEPVYCAGPELTSRGAQ